MQNFRNALLSAIALVAFSAPLQAAEVRAFDRAAFAEAQQSGRPILVNVKAWWCPVCASQGSTIKETIKDPAYAKLVVFQINYDKQKNELPAFNVTKQGAIIAYRGAQQTGRLDFVTDKTSIRALIAKTLP